MESKRFPAIVTTVVMFAALGGVAVLAQDKYTVNIPDGLTFSEFRGYESWQVVSVSHPLGNSETSGEVLNVIVANPVMVEAYLSGIPGNGKPFPDGAKAAKIQYIPKKSEEAPSDVVIPDRLRNVAFITKDSKRFANTNGWGYGTFSHDAASDKFTPIGTGATCGVKCHAIVKSKDYVFTSYQKR